MWALAATADVTGGPGYARAVNFPINDDFSGGTLDRRYNQMGIGSAPTGSAYEQAGTLVLAAGPTTTESKIEIALHRHFFLHQSFHLQVDAGISSESTVLGSAGLAIANPMVQEDTLSRIGFVINVVPESAFARVFTNVPIETGGMSQPFSFSTDTLYTLEIDYDAATQTMILSAPEAEFSRLVVMSTYVGGFQVLLTSQTDSVGGLVAESKAVFDNLESDLTADTYLLSYTPLSLDGIDYSDALPTDPRGGRATYFTGDYPPFARVSVDDTWVQLDGQTSYNAALISAGGAWHGTIYTPADCASLATSLPAGTILNRFIFNVLVATGPGKDYLWNPSPASLGADCGIGTDTRIWAIDPSSASAGMEVTLYGFNFGVTPGTLTIGSIPVTARSWENDRIIFNVPDELPGGKHTVTVESQADSDSTDFYVRPAITSVYPKEVTSGDVLWLTGTGYGGVEDTAALWVDGKHSSILSRSSLQISSTVPKTAGPGQVTVATTINGVSSRPMPITVRPHLISLSFKPVRNEPVLTIGGANFGEYRDDGSFGVLLDAQRLTIGAWDAQVISAQLESTLSNSDHTIVVIANGQVSNTLGFRFTRNQIISGYVDAFTSPGNSWKGDGIEGQLLIETGPGAIMLPPGDTPTTTLDKALVEPQLRGALRAIGTQTIDGDNRSGRLQNIYRIKFDQNIDVATAQRRLQVVRSVVGAEPNAIPQLSFTPSDPYNQPIEGLDVRSRAYTWDYEQTRLDRAWDIFQGSSMVRIGIIDTGVANHADLNSRRYWTSRDSDYDIRWHADKPPHGTKVASVCCAAWDGAGAAGVDRRATFTPYLDSTVSEIKDALFDAVADGMHIVNMSFGFPQLGTINRKVLKDGINWAYANGVLLVASVDNPEGGCNTSWYPAEFPEVLPVNNYQDPDKCGWTWANNGIMAPGGSDSQFNPVALATFNSLATNSDGEPPYTDTGFGTSYAAPFVAGAAALIKGWNPLLTDYQIKQALTSTARNDPGSYNGGIIDAYGSLMYAERLNTGQLDWDQAFNETNEASQKAFSIGHGWRKFTVGVQNRGDGVLHYELDILTLCGWSDQACFQTDFNDYVSKAKGRHYSTRYQAESQAQYFGYLSPNASVNVPIYVDTEGWRDQQEINTLICVYPKSDDIKYSPADKPDPWSCNVYTVKMIDCFTSVALEHTDMAPEVETLRKFRDASAKPRLRGKELVETYYRISPAIVEAMANDPAAKEEYVDLVRRFKDTLGAQVVADTAPFLLTMGMSAALEAPFTQDDANVLKAFADRLADDPSTTVELANLIPGAKVFVDMHVGKARKQVLQDLLERGL